MGARDLSCKPVTFPAFCMGTKWKSTLACSSRAFFSNSSVRVVVIRSARKRIYKYLTTTQTKISKLTNCLGVWPSVEAPLYSPIVVGKFVSKTVGSDGARVDYTGYHGLDTVGFVVNITNVHAPLVGEENSVIASRVDVMHT